MTGPLLVIEVLCAGREAVEFGWRDGLEISEGIPCMSVLEKRPLDHVYRGSQMYPSCKVMKTQLKVDVVYI